jgi:hypothetical protein
MDLGWPALTFAGNQGTEGRDPQMNRPYKVPGIGWILAVIALIVAILGLVGVTIPFLSTTYVLIILLALAILL